VEEILGHLESSELVARGDPSHDARPLEVREMAIGRTPRNLGDLSLDIRNAEGALRRGQEFDHGSTTDGVALINSVQEQFDKLVQVFDGFKGLQPNVSFFVARSCASFSFPQRISV
jgi:hypothetical protein